MNARGHEDKTVYRTERRRRRRRRKAITWDFLSYFFILSFFPFEVFWYFWTFYVFQVDLLKYCLIVTDRRLIHTDVLIRAVWTGSMWIWALILYPHTSTPPPSSVPNEPYGFYGRKASLNQLTCFGPAEATCTLGWAIGRQGDWWWSDA